MEAGRLKLETARPSFEFLSRSPSRAMPRRRREIRAIEPLKAIDLRGDVLEREISHFYWQTTKHPGSSPVPRFSSHRMAGFQSDVKDFFLQFFWGRALKLDRPWLFVPAWLGTELRRM
jgi:hypothetical protein